MKFPFPFKFTDITITTTAATASSWPWPRCGTSPRTLSFRAEPSDEAELVPNPAESAVISGLRSDRLFFDPGTTSSILEGVKGEERESVAVVAMESRNPFVDFRVSMEEMVEACGVRDDWEFLEELLEWYLRVNDESNHCYVVGAFVDLLVSSIDDKASSSSSSSSSSTSFSFTSPLSLSSSSTEDRHVLHKNVLSSSVTTKLSR